MGILDVTSGQMLVINPYQKRSCSQAHWVYSLLRGFVLFPAMVANGTAGTVALGLAGVPLGTATAVAPAVAAAVAAAVATGLTAGLVGLAEVTVVTGTVSSAVGVGLAAGVAVATLAGVAVATLAGVGMGRGAAVLAGTAMSEACHRCECDETILH